MYRNKEDWNSQRNPLQPWAVLKRPQNQVLDCIIET